MASSADEAVAQFARDGNVTLKGSTAKGTGSVVLSAALTVLMLVVGLFWLRSYPDEIYRFAPFALAALFAWSLVKTLTAVGRGDLVLTREGVTHGREQQIRWADIEQVEVTGVRRSPASEPYMATVRLRLGPGDARRSVQLPSDLQLPSLELGPVISQCRALALRG